MKSLNLTGAKNSDIRMTEYSHGAGCGCKIAPQLLEDMLKTSSPQKNCPQLLVGNDSKDDAAVFDLGNGSSVISTTDFFMPIVDDPFEFGQIAASNAMSDVYAMGGNPLMAISIFGWPVNKLGPEIAREVIEGGRHACQLAGIPLAGGHSIDTPEPIFGLAVTGHVKNKYLKRNNQATAGSNLYLTKPLGIGILATAQNKKILKAEHARIAPDVMCQLNTIGAEFATLDSVTAMTDVTGFGLMGHLLEMCEGSQVKAKIQQNAVPLLPEVEYYLDHQCSPGGAQRNFDSYGHKLGLMSQLSQQIFCDPQTSGGLLVAVSPDGESKFLEIAAKHNLDCVTQGPIGNLSAPDNSDIYIEIVDSA